MRDITLVSLTDYPGHSECIKYFLSVEFEDGNVIINSHLLDEWRVEYE